MNSTAIYLRISDDREGEALGVARQREDCLALAERRGYTVTEVYEDNDLSASTLSRKKRPAYQRLLADARTGQFRVILAYTSSRLTRRPRELEDLIELVQRHGTRIEYVNSPSYDLNTADGRQVARMLAAGDAAEAERIGERTRRKLQQNAKEGKPHGGHRPFGWEADRLTVRESEAAVIREAARRILAGEPVRSVFRDFNDRGLYNASGKPWTHPTFRKCIVHARHGGIRMHNGQEMGQGNWPAIIPPETWRALVRTLADPARVHTPGRAGRIHLLSGLARCGACGGPLRVGQSKGYESYRCQMNHCVSRRRDYLEQYVEAVIIGRLSRPDAAALLLADNDGGERERAAEAAERTRQRLDDAAAGYASGLLTMRQLETINAQLRPELAALEAASTPPPDRSATLGSLVGAIDVEAAWRALSPDARRTVVRLLLEITVDRARRGSGFTTQGIRLEWR